MIIKKKEKKEKQKRKEKKENTISQYQCGHKPVPKLVMEKVQQLEKMINGGE